MTIGMTVGMTIGMTIGLSIGMIIGMTRVTTSHVDKVLNWFFCNLTKYKFILL